MTQKGKCAVLEGECGHRGYCRSCEVCLHLERGCRCSERDCSGHQLTGLGFPGAMIRDSVICDQSRFREHSGDKALSTGTARLLLSDSPVPEPTAQPETRRGQSGFAGGPPLHSGHLPDGCHLAVEPQNPAGLFRTRVLSVSSSTVS